MRFIFSCDTVLVDYFKSNVIHIQQLMSEYKRVEEKSLQKIYNRNNSGHMTGSAGNPNLPGQTTEGRSYVKEVALRHDDDTTEEGKY